MSDRRPLTLHLGAHRTGSTSAQRAIEAWAAREADIAFAGPDAFRPALPLVLGALGAAPALWRAATPLLLAMAAPAVRRVVTSGAGPRVLSEECILGPMSSCLLDRRGVYPGAPRRLRAVRRMIGRRPVRPVLTVRAYDEWFVSMYSWTMLLRPLPEAAALAEEWAGRARGWPEVVSEIVEVFGGCEVIEFGAVRRDPGAVLTALIGDSGAEIPVERAGASLSAAGLAEVAERRRAGEAIGIADLGPIRTRHRGGPPLQPFSAPTLAALEARYQRDLARIEASGAAVTWARPAASDHSGSAEST